MESRPQYVSADWWGRIISVVSLAVAIGAVVYVRMNHDQLVGLPDTLRSEFQGKLAEEVAAYKQAYEQEQTNNLEVQIQAALKSHDEWLSQKWNEQLGSALDEFKKDADQLLSDIETKETKAQEARQLAFRQQLQSLESTAAAAPSTPATQDEPSPSAAPGDSLAVLHTVQRPTGDHGPLIRIENKGSEDALITRVRFVPQADFEVTADERSLSIVKGTGDIITLAYDSSDNRSSKPGMHGLYDRTMTEPIRVPAGGTLTFRVLIEDPTHAGWGFSGKLMLDYNSQTPLIVDSARVIFQSVASATSS